MMSLPISQLGELFFAWQRKDQVSPEMLDEAWRWVLGMIREVEKDALIRPSNLGLLFSFPLLRREGKIGDRVIDAFFEKKQQVIRFVPTIQEAPIEEREFFVDVVAQGAELVDL